MHSNVLRAIVDNYKFSTTVENAEVVLELIDYHEEAIATAILPTYK